MKSLTTGNNAGENSSRIKKKNTGENYAGKRVSFNLSALSYARIKSNQIWLIPPLFPSIRGHITGKDKLLRIPTLIPLTKREGKREKIPENQT